MALLYELIRQGCTNLTIQGWNNGNEVDLLVGARCVIDELMCVAIARKIPDGEQGFIGLGTPSVPR